MGRQWAYLSVRGTAAALFVFAVFGLQEGILAGVLAMTAGIVGLLTCIGVNAGGPGEQAGARLESMHLDAVRPPQGDWPPYEEDRIVEGEILSELRTPEPPAA